MTSLKLLKNFRNQEENVDSFTEDELNTIIKEANRYIKNFIRFIYATGIRPGEHYILSIFIKNKPLNIILNGAKVTKSINCLS